MIFARIAALVGAVLLVGASAAEQPAYYVKDGSVFAQFAGQTYEISGADWAETYPFKSIVLTADLDSDGKLDAVIALATGGNCCPSEYAVVSHRGGSFFANATHPDFTAWNDPTLVQTPNGPLLSVRQAPDGVGNTSLEESLIQFRLEGGQLREVLNIKNAAMIVSRKTLTSKALLESGKDQL